MRFRLTTFGELSLRDMNTQRVLAIPRKALAILSVLASARRADGVARDKILGLLWPDADDSGRGALKQTVYELRQTLGARDVILGTAALSLDASVMTSDVAEFEDACAAADWRRAVALYAGPFLERFAVRGAAEFEYWVDAQRAHYHQRYTTALEHAAADATHAGDVADAIVLWRRLAGAEPLSARFAAGLMNALALAGDTSGALAHFRVHGELLKRELGAEPDATLLAMAERLRAPSSIVAAPPPSAEANSETPATASDRPGAPAREAVKVAPIKRTRRAFTVGITLVLGAAVGLAAWREHAHARVIASILVPRNSSRLALDPGSRLYIDGGARFGSSLTAVDLHTLRPLRLPHGAGVLVDPITHWYWSGDYTNHTVLVRNGFTNAEIGRIPVAGCPHYLALDGAFVLAAEQCSDHIAVIDARARRLVRDIPIPTLSRAEVGGSKGMGDIFVNTNTGIAYFEKDNIPERLDPRTWEIRETPNFGGLVIGVNQLMNRVYARFDAGLRVIDGATEGVLAEVPLPALPTSIAVGVGGRRVFVTTEKALVVLDGRDNTIQSVTPFADGFVANFVAVDEPHGQAYVLGSGAGDARTLRVIALDN